MTRQIEAEAGLVACGVIRRVIVELLWPAWQQYGEACGITAPRFQRGLHDCSLCGLCVRYCAEVKKESVLYFKGRGIDRKPALVDPSRDQCGGCGECFHRAPVDGLSPRALPDFFAYQSR